MEPRIEHLVEKKLIGIKSKMSLADYKIAELWKRFLPLKSNIQNSLSKDLIAMTIYPPSYFENFNPNNIFEKWAAVEVSDFNQVPEAMEHFILQGGLYAVFEYKGLNTDFAIFQHIYASWLPQSDYVLDDRPHFEILGEKYRNGKEDSEEEIWIPIRSM